MMSGKHFRKCVDPCPRFLTEGDSHELCVSCLGMEHARAALEGAACGHCETLSMRVLRSRMDLFSSDGQMRSPRGAGPAVAEAARRVRSWGSQRDLVGDFEAAEAVSRPSSADSDIPLSRAGARFSVSPAQRGDRSWQQHSDSEEVDVLSVIDDDFRVSGPRHQGAPDYNELLEVVTRAVARLDISWPQEVQEPRLRGRLDERFLQHHAPPPRRPLPFFPELHSELCKSWDKPYSTRLNTSKLLDYSDVQGIRDRGYGEMPRVEEALASYLSPRLASMERPALPSKPCRTTSTLIGKAYMASGRAGASLHTGALLQAYQADLLQDIASRGGPTEEDMAELRRTTDLSLRVTKETARSVGRSMAALVATERHLWLNLAGVREKDRNFLLDAPVSTAGLFGNAVDSVVDRFQHVRTQGEALKHYLPRRSRPGAAEAAGSGARPSTYREDRKQSVASRAPPQAAGVARRRSRPQPPERVDLRTVIQSRQGFKKRS